MFGAALFLVCMAFGCEYQVFVFRSYTLLLYYTLGSGAWVDAFLKKEKKERWLSGLISSGR